MRCCYVTNQMGTALTGDPRDLALRNAVYSIIHRYHSREGSHNDSDGGRDRSDGEDSA